MEHTTRPWSRLVYLPALALAVALVAAVSSWAASPATSTTPSQGTAPAAQEQSLPIQDTQTTPTPRAEGRGRPGGKEDCPERDGSGGASGSAAPQSSAPQTAPSGSEV